MDIEERLILNDPETKNGRPLGQFSRDLWLLMKPELTLLSVFTSLGSAYLAIDIPSESQLLIFPLLAIGTLLVGGGSGALNQFIERDLDRMMKRTEKRPLPDARINPSEAMLFGSVISLIGIAILASINVLTAFLALSTFASYVFLYTPLKRITPIATIIGAIPGALPTLIGWAAIQNSLSIPSLTLFAILFYWQLPHFYSIGWLYRNDYSNAGFKLLTSTDNSGKKVAKQIVMHQLILWVISLSPVAVGLVSYEYIAVSALISSIFLYYGIQFSRSLRAGTSTAAARKLFFSSLFFLPIIFSAMIIFKIH